MKIDNKRYILLDLGYFDFILWCEAARLSEDPGPAACALVVLNSLVLFDDDYFSHFYESCSKFADRDSHLLASSMRGMGDEYIRQFYNAAFTYVLTHEIAHCAVANKTPFSREMLAAELRSSRQRLDLYLKMERESPDYPDWVLNRWRGSVAEFQEIRIKSAENYRNILEESPKILEELACDTIARQFTFANDPSIGSLAHIYSIHLTQSSLFEARAAVAPFPDDPRILSHSKAQAVRLRIAGDDLRTMASRHRLEGGHDRLAETLESHSRGFGFGVVPWLRSMKAKRDLALRGEVLD